MVGVVLGHWLVADVRWVDGQVVESSVLADAPELWPLTWLVLVIAVFFFVGGFANAHSWRSAQRRGDGYAGFVHRRLVRLLAPTLAFLAVVVPVGVLVDAAGGLGVGAAGVVVLQPLWFLGVYVLAVALTPLTLRLHERWGVLVPSVLVAAAVLCDVLARGADLSGVGYVNAVVVWVLVHQLGYFYADGRLTRAVATALAALGWTGAVALTQIELFGYSSFMVGVPGVDPGNMHPPTLAVLALGVGAIGGALLLRPLVERAAHGERAWRVVVLANLSIMTLYLWHETALVVAARLVLPLGYPAPPPGTAAWWFSHTAWLLAPAAVLAVVVAVAGPLERRARLDPVAPSRLARRAAAVSVLLLSTGFLALAGSTVTSPFATAARLGPLRVSVAAGAVLVACAAAVIWALPHGRRATIEAVAVAGLAPVATACAYLIGVGPFPEDAVMAGVLLVLAVPALGVSLASASPRRRRPPTGAAISPRVP
jgi:peptidoglycan/LPS O-acetylase OafA/YrhL